MGVRPTISDGRVCVVMVPDEIDGSRARQVRGFCGYAVTEDGRVWSWHTYGPNTRIDYSSNPRLLRSSVSSSRRKYRAVELKAADGSKQTICVHVLVIEAFVGPRPPGLMVRHLDGDTTNNRAQNLAYGTSADNYADMVKHGRQTAAGASHHKAVMTPEMVILARKLCVEDHFTIPAVANRFGIKYYTMRLAVIGKTWKTLNDVSPPMNTRSQR